MESDPPDAVPEDSVLAAMGNSQSDVKRKEYKLHFGRLVLVCFAAVAFCGWLVWFASTYLTDCCGP